MPHLEEQFDPSETKEERKLHGQDAMPARRSWDRLQGIQADPAGLDPHYDIVEKAAQSAHAELLSTAWVRRAAHEQLEGIEIHAETEGRNVYIVCNQPFGAGPLFSRFPPNIRNSNRVSLLGWTSKMGCPSFSLPAGPGDFGGSCPGSVAGVSLTEPEKLITAAELVTRVTHEQVHLGEATCEFCYAFGGNYRYGSKQLASVVLFAWTKRAVRDGSFVEVLDWAMKNSDFGESAYTEKKILIPAETRGKFFRIHDSGDFYSREYLKAWKQVANLNPDIMFWAPTRIWATDFGLQPTAITEATGGIQAVNEINDPPNNLIIRPSTYMVNRPVPPNAELGPGWASWTTVYGVKVKPTEGPAIASGHPYDWDCQTYATKQKGHTCRSARAPDRAEGCRACWLHPGLSINYTLH